MDYASTIDITAYVARCHQLGITDEQIQAVVGPLTALPGQVRASRSATLDRDLGELIRAAVDAQHPLPSTATPSNGPRWENGVCTCCGGSVRGWSHAGRAAGHRAGVTRLHRAAHGSCHCGRDLDQYGQCAHGVDTDPVGRILAETGLLPADVADDISHGQLRDQGWTN